MPCFTRACNVRNRSKQIYVSMIMEHRLNHARPLAGDMKSSHPRAAVQAIPTRKSTKAMLRLTRLLIFIIGISVCGL